MVGKTALAAFAASALLLAGGQSAFAADDGAPFQKLLEVTVDSQTAVDSVTTKFDAAEYKRVNDDGTITLNVFATADEEAALKGKGYTIGATIEDSNTGKQRMKERQEILDQEALAKTVAEQGLKGTKFEGRSVVAVPGDTVIQRANTFTDIVGPSGATTTARFLYVEAFNKSTGFAANGSATGPTLALSYAGADGVYVPAQNISRFNDTDTTPVTYMYHRQLFRLPANAPADIKTVRVATTATTGGAAASVETFPVTEWLGKDLPPHVAGFKNQPFFTHYMDPTENRADLDALAAAHPELVSVENMPELSSGYQRKSMANMNGTVAITSAPAATLGATLAEIPVSEMTAAQPVVKIPFNAIQGQTIRATVDGIPARSTDLVIALKDPSGKTLQTIDTGTSPEVLTQTPRISGTYTFEVSGYQGELGDFSYRVQEVTGPWTQTVTLTSKDWGHQGGDQVQAEFLNPGAANSPLGVTVTDKLISVSLATGADGALTSTAGQVVAAINEKASALVTAATFRGDRGAGIVQPRAKVNLDDFLNAPASVARGPFQQHLYRIGTKRDGSKPGVFLFCQQHAREWATGLTCVQTAHELVENYATDPQTKQLLDNVEVFISPNSNPDGAHYSMYDSNVQRKTLANRCDPIYGPSDISQRNVWGVDMNRNSGEYSLFDGYAGASEDCTNETYAGPSEYSEPETRNEGWVVDHFPNIKFMNNIHSYGGYFMWAPGAYKNDGMRTTTPAPNIGIEKYFFEAGEKILRRIKDSRGTVILPQRTGPIADVLYSAAGNSADDGYYRKGIIAYSFETGADRMLNTTTGIQPTTVGFQPCFGAVGTGGNQGACPQNGSLVNEGRDEALEFAAGNFGLVESAYDYGKDVTAPTTAIEVSADKTSGAPVNYTFNWLDEAAVIHYTTDGSTPTLSSTKYNSQRARSVGEVLTLSTPGKHTVKWFAVDIKGNQSAVQSKTVSVGETVDGPVGGTVPATLALTLGTPATFGAFTPGVAKEYTATTEATVISTAGDAALSVADPSPTNTGYLVNGTFALAKPLQGLGTIKTWSAPTSNEKVTVTFKQAIGDKDPLRTGTYSKTLTFTLSTTNP
ncbi:M14 family metallopeptidase [Solirubrobacter phytolaccae]|uniref:M14 family metallopeptidase n=1 Tax=Solirubrobacter phytolaccae TaxID=1404360 RepID=A0A9X3SD41_9ACTN|nr:M14 family metallopeptidase [Solirubrobacter phytolaccae]MDA0183245.1 M14 family metallopeptidase [Solirubrobacter phytolaccae]